MAETQPTLFEWAGGAEALERLTVEFYKRVVDEPLLKEMFKYMPKDHPQHVATFLGEVFGGPRDYTRDYGGYPRLLKMHRYRDIQPEQRKRWVELIMEAADVVGLPADAAFRSAFVSYIEWGSRRAMANSKPDAVPEERESIKQWGWGEATPGE